MAKAQEIKIRTRYAPSPTGFFHIGGARTALFNYLFAKHNKGVFICRIEDTDTERNVEGGIDSQLNNLDWLQISPDESARRPGECGPYIQTQKLKRYQDLAHKLLKEGRAYYCFCTKEELQAQREEALNNKQTPKYNRKCLHLSVEDIKAKLKQGIPATIRLKTPDKRNIIWHDLIRGKMDVPTSALTDPVILKSNGIPMYNFAVVVDDYDMQISHVLRGEEHISNTPYQIVIKEALGFGCQPIQYGHLSIIVDESGKKLSKRNRELKQFIEDYKQMGFVPEAIVNFLALLGWSTHNNKEIMIPKELVQEFDINRVSKAPAYFDFQKMMWIGNEYIKKMNDEQYLQYVKPFIHFDTKIFINSNTLDLLLLIFKQQLSYATQINELVTETFLSTNFDNISDEIKTILKNPNFQKCILAFGDVLKDFANITLTNANEIVQKVKSLTNLNGKDLYFPIRFVAIAKEHGPEMNKILVIVGKEQLLKNIGKCIQII